MKNVDRTTLSGDSILIRIILLGILWGLIEVFISPVIKLHARPVFGLLMPFLIAIYISIAYYTVPKTGALLAMALIAALFEFFLAGMILHGAFLAILLEGLIAEVVFLVAGFNTWSILINGILLQVYTAFHPLLTKGLFCQSSHFLFFKRWFGEHFFNLDNNGLIVTLLSLHVVMGICAGLLVLLLFRLRNVRV